MRADEMYKEIDRRIDEAKENSREYHILEEVLNVSQRNILINDMFNMVEKYGISTGEVDVSEFTDIEFPIKKLKWKVTLEAEE